jgi:hypothetical protein
MPVLIPCHLLQYLLIKFEREQPLFGTYVIIYNFRGRLGWPETREKRQEVSQDHHKNNNNRDNKISKRKSERIFLLRI